MDAPQPNTRTSPMAGLVNACARLYIRCARNLIAAQQRELDEARNLNHRLRTAANYAGSQAAGYIDHPYRTQRGKQ